MTLIQLLPWPFSATTALCFALLARKAGRNWLPWAIVGGAASLVITTLTLGAAEAAFIPVSHDAYVGFCSRAVLVAVLLNVISGWLLTASLHRRHVSLWNAAKWLWARVRNGNQRENNETESYTNVDSAKPTAFRKPCQQSQEMSRLR
jgi:hypothetical protein